MTESSSKWTFRFRLAKIEHLWWTLVSLFLLTSLVLITLSFLSGDNNESLGILALSSATFIAIVKYMLPAWESRHYIRNRWCAWTGPSRTGIARTKTPYCRDRENRLRLAAMADITTKDRVPSDRYGWHIGSLKGIEVDPTDILKGTKDVGKDPEEPSPEKTFIYDDGYLGGDSQIESMCPNVSLLWGFEHGGFQP
ncbi:hypothetical protein B0O99DRAFT_634188 [Bisporella sp. PMI_857]|nr:hypothetical protein B0O99DRAFT_634188 [Bisporella sp. PMI_857]